MCEWAGGGRAGDTASFLRITELWKALTSPERQVFSKCLFQMSPSSLVPWGVYLSGVSRGVHGYLQLYGGVWGGGGQEYSPGDSACSGCGERTAAPGRSSERDSQLDGGGQLGGGPWVHTL